MQRPSYANGRNILELDTQPKFGRASDARSAFERNTRRKINPHTHMYHPPKFQLNPKNHDKVVIFAHLACAWLLLLLLLLLACLPNLVGRP